ncbi:MAG: IS1096 element passenger TnpR family protein [Bacteroidales bacterium]
MLIYKFKISFEDQTDFSREIALRADQTFEDFHQALLGNLGLDPGMLASFYLCDHHFRKRKEIRLADTNTVSEESQTPPLMQDAVLKDYIDDPHQRLLFIYDSLNQWNFYIEMVKIQPAEKNTVYPAITRQEGGVPRELTATPKQVPGVEPDKDFRFEDDEEAPGDLSGSDQLEEGQDDYFEEDQADQRDDFEQNK